MRYNRYRGAIKTFELKNKRGKDVQVDPKNNKISYFYYNNFVFSYKSFHCISLYKKLSEILFKFNFILQYKIWQKCLLSSLLVLQFWNVVHGIQKLSDKVAHDGSIAQRLAWPIHCKLKYKNMLLHSSVYVIFSILDNISLSLFESKKKRIEMVVWLICQTIQTFVNYSEVIKPHEWIGKRCIGYFMLTIPLVGTSGFSIISSTTDWTSLTNWSATPGSVWMCVTHKWTPEGNCKRLRFHPFFVSASVRR